MHLVSEAKIIGASQQLALRRSQKIGHLGCCETIRAGSTSGQGDLTETGGQCRRLPQRAAYGKIIRGKRLDPEGNTAFAAKRPPTPNYLRRSWPPPTRRRARIARASCRRCIATRHGSSSRAAAAPTCPKRRRPTCRRITFSLPADCRRHRAPLEEMKGGCATSRAPRPPRRTTEPTRLK